MIWGKNSIDRVTKCSKCGTYLTLENFDPFKKSILGVVVIVGGCLTFLIKEVPIMWFGGFLWGISIIATAFQNWGKIQKLDGDAQEKKVNFVFECLRTFFYKSKFSIIECLNCKQKLRVPKIGKKLKVTCPKCKNVFSATPLPFLKRIFHFN